MSRRDFRTVNGSAGSSSLVRAGLQNAGWSSVDYAIVPLLWLLTTPYFIQSLGPDQYGIWMLVNAFVGFSGMANLGLGDATIRFIAQYRASSDDKAIANVIRLTFMVYAVLCTVLPVLVCLSAPLLVSDVFSVHQDSAAMAVTALRVGGVAIAIRLLDSIPTSILHGYERFDLSAKIRIPTAILTMMLNVLLVFLGYSVVELTVASVTILVAGALVKAAFAKRLLSPAFAFSGTSVRSNSREVTSFAVYSWLQAVGGTMLGQADRLLVASLIGTRTLAYYAICVQFSQQIHALLAQALSFLLPMVSALRIDGDTGRISRTYFASANIVVVVATILGIPAFLLSHEILETWIGPSFASEAELLFRAFVVVFTLLSTSIVPHYIMNALGFHRLNTILALSGGIVITLATWWLVPAMGMIGAALARFLSLPISVVGRTILHFKVIDDKRWNAGLILFLPILLLFALLGFLQELSILEGLNGWARAGVVAMLTLVGSGLVGVFLLAFNRKGNGTTDSPTKA